MSCLMIPGKLNVQLLQGWENWVVVSKMQGSEKPLLSHGAHLIPN